MIHDDLRSRLEKRIVPERQRVSGEVEKRKASLSTTGENIAPEKQCVSGAADGRWYLYP